MHKKKPLKHLVGVIFLASIPFIVMLALFLDSLLPNPIFGVFKTDPEPTTEPTEQVLETEIPTEAPTQDTQEPTQGPTQNTEPSGNHQDTPVTPPEDLPSSVEIPTETDPETGKNMGISFPCTVPGYNLVIEKMAPYNGMFVEDGSNATVQNVAMLLVYNNGDFPVEYTQISVMHGQEELIFDISALPAGERLVVQEKNGKTITSSEATAANALIVQRANMEMSEDLVQVTDNGNNTLTIKNMTNKTIATVRVFYKYYMEDEDVYVGGIAFTVRVTRLGAGASVTIQPSHYTSKTSRVVMVLTYDSEV